MEREDYIKTVDKYVSSKLGFSVESQNIMLRFEELYKQFHEGIAHFWYRKSDGTLRSAYGTLLMDIVQKHGGVPEGKTVRAFSGAVSYFDLEKDSWRSFKIESLQEVDLGYGDEVTVVIPE